MAYEFTVGKFLNGLGIDQALALIEKPVKAAALFQAANLQRAFREQGHASRGGPRWADWSRAYAQDRARKGRSNVLVDSGILRQSMTSQVRTTGAGVEALVGTNVWYAKVHQEGVRKIVYRKAHHRTMRRKRGRWVMKDGKRVFKKGRKLKPRAVELSDGTSINVLPRQQIQGQAFRLHIPKRPVAVITAQDGLSFQQRVEKWVGAAVNGAQGGPA
jgi:phage gpG-like protein